MSYFAIPIINKQPMSILDIFSTNSAQSSVAGKKLIREKRVEEQDLATAYGTGKIPVFATPALINFMIQTCTQLIEPYLPIGKDTVGIEINIKHLKIVSLGELLRCTATLKFIDDKRLYFDVVVVNENMEEVGAGAHERVIVDAAQFMANMKK